MDIGDLVYIIIFIVVIISGAFSKRKEKKDKNSQKQKNILSSFLSGEEVQLGGESPEEASSITENVNAEGRGNQGDERDVRAMPVDEINENDELINEVVKKMAAEEARRKEEERIQMQNIAELLHAQEHKTDVRQKAETYMKADEAEEQIIEELEDEGNVGYNVDFSDPEQVRNAIISAEIFNKKY